MQQSSDSAKPNKILYHTRLPVVPILGGLNFNFGERGLPTASTRRGAPGSPSRCPRPWSEDSRRPDEVVLVKTDFLVRPTFPPKSKLLHHLHQWFSRHRRRHRYSRRFTTVTARTAWEGSKTAVMLQERVKVGTSIEHSPRSHPPPTWSQISGHSSPYLADTSFR